MPQGVVVSIHLTPTGAAAPAPVGAATAVEGRGLEGDRYFAGSGSYSARPGPDREVTLIEIEAIEALEREHGISIPPGDSRRNVVTRGVRLDDLVGREFRLGAATLRGVRRCDQCAYLESLTRPGVLKGLVDRGGLRAQVVSGGVVRVGDTLETS